MTQNSKTYIDELSDMTDSPDINDHQSEVCQYFKGRNVLITGASGFFGILLIEKLLRCCPGIAKMYIFIKKKKGKSAEERFKEQFDDVVYDRLKKEQPDFLTKIIMIEADFSEVNLNLSPENRKRLLDTNVIFHMAATVRFNESLRIAMNINVRGAKEFLLFAREMPNLEAFVHVSTAFSHCIYQSIEEKFYPSPFETDKILMLLDVLDDEKLEKITPTLVGKWPNTYVYSKAISEDTVRQYGAGLPICIVRPSIVTTTAKEPIPGWINNIYGAVGIVMGTGLGLLRTLYCIPYNTAEIIPADYVIANVIVAGWDVAKRKDNPDVPETEKTPIYNCVASTQNPISWAEFMKLNEKYGLDVPSINAIWYYMLILQKHYFLNKISVILLHIIPAVIFDTVALLTGRKPMLLKTYKKIATFTEVISYFTIREWKFRNDSVLKLWNSLNPVDQQIFSFNAQDICWDKYLSHMIPGLRLYVAKESNDNIEAARMKFKKLKIAHYTVLTICFILLAWAIVTIINFIISFFL